jgi:prepilin-type N-terminal cleavage/methylation domain-containing protein
MSIRVGQHQNRVAHGPDCFAFTLVEVMVSLVILAMVISGVCYGYAQANRIAVWDSMSQAAQAFAIQGMESARAAKWNPWVNSTNAGPDPGGSQDELPAESNGNPSLIQTNMLDIPIKGDPQTNYNYYATNFVYVTQPSANPPIRQIVSQCVWTFPLTGQQFTNTVITLRGPDQ